jgi:hypothetical protein
MLPLISHGILAFYLSKQQSLHFVPRESLHTPGQIAALSHQIESQQHKFIDTEHEI